MDKEQLRAQLEQLHAELQQVGPVDDSDREMLQKLARDIQGLLEREDDRAQHYRSLRERLREAVAHLEASHPQTTLLMRQVIDQLAPLGI